MRQSARPSTSWGHEPTKYNPDGSGLRKPSAGVLPTLGCGDPALAPVARDRSRQPVNSGRRSCGYTDQLNHGFSALGRSMRTPRSSFGFALSLAISVLCPPGADAQNPDLMLTEAQRDSILKTYHNTFPIWGRKAIARGFDLPKPLGINALGVYVNQPIDISNLGLSTGTNPIAPISQIQFGTNTSSIWNVSARADLWLFPFLNVYGFGGRVWANTTVELVTPIAFTSSVDQSGYTGGLGLTGAMGLQRNFISADVNWSWTDLDKIIDPVEGRILSFRFGRNLKLSGQKRLAFWVGTMNQKFGRETDRTIALSEVIPQETVDRIRTQLENIDQSP